MAYSNQRGQKLPYGRRLAVRMMLPQCVDVGGSQDLSFPQQRNHFRLRHRRRTTPLSIQPWVQKRISTSDFEKSRTVPCEKFLTSDFQTTECNPLTGCKLKIITAVITPERRERGEKKKQKRINETELFSDTKSKDCFPKPLFQWPLHLPSCAYNLLSTVACYSERVECFFCFCFFLSVQFIR